MTDNPTEADSRLITAFEEMLAHHRGELELESRKQESDLEQRIKRIFELDAKRRVDEMMQQGEQTVVLFPSEYQAMMQAFRELLGVIDSQREALEYLLDECCDDEMDDDYNPHAAPIGRAKQTLTLSAPLQGWKEWGV